MAVYSPQPAPIPMQHWGAVKGHGDQMTPGASSSSSSLTPTWSYEASRLTDPRTYDGRSRTSEPSLPKSMAAATGGFDVRQRASTPTLMQGFGLQSDQDARRGSDEQGNKKRPQSCDICRVRKVKCVLAEGVLPGQGKCKQCNANDVSCTYAYVPKRPGPQTSSAKSIARREERERQAKAAALTAAARAAGIREKGKTRKGSQFHEGSGSTPPSSNEASRKSSAVTSQHASPSTMAVEFRHLGFGANDGMPMPHHHQTGLYEGLGYSEGSASYHYDPSWHVGFPTDTYTSAASTPNAMGTGGNGSRHVHTLPPQNALVYPSLSRRSSMLDGNGTQPAAGPVGSSAAGAALARPHGFSSMSRPGSPSMGAANWSGCLHDGAVSSSTITPDPLEALKSLSRPSSPRASSMLPAVDLFHPLTEPLHTFTYSQPLFPQSMVGHAAPTPSSTYSTAAPPPQNHHITHAESLPVGMDIGSGAQRMPYGDVPLAAMHGSHDASTSAHFQQPPPPPPSGSLSQPHIGAPLQGQQADSLHMAHASSGAPASMQMWSWNFPPMS